MMLLDAESELNDVDSHFVATKDEVQRKNCAAYAAVLRARNSLTPLQAKEFFWSVPLYALCPIFVLQ
jgi:hypothetical protein